MGGRKKGGKNVEPGEGKDKLTMLRASRMREARSNLDRCMETPTVSADRTTYQGVHKNTAENSTTKTLKAFQERKKENRENNLKDQTGNGEQQM